MPSVPPEGLHSKAAGYTAASLPHASCWAHPCPSLLHGGLRYITSFPRFQFLRLYMGGGEEGSWTRQQTNSPLQPCVPCKRINIPII